MPEIPLTQGMVAIVDSDDYDRILATCPTWHARRKVQGTGVSFYAVSSDGRQIRMHRLVMNAPDGAEVDHRNHNGLDNRKENLRICTNQQNQFNGRARKRRATTAKYKGVFQEKSGRWRSQICANGTLHYLGKYATEEDAARAYDEKAKELHGEFACLNFPDRTFDTPIQRLSSKPGFAAMSKETLSRISASGHSARWNI